MFPIPYLFSTVLSHGYVIISCYFYNMQNCNFFGTNPAEIMKFCNLQFHPMVFRCKIAAQFPDTFLIKKICRDFAWLTCREKKLGTGFWYWDIIDFQQTKQFIS